MAVVGVTVAGTGPRTRARHREQAPRDARQLHIGRRLRGRICLQFGKRAHPHLAARKAAAAAVARAAVRMLRMAARSTLDQLLLLVHRTRRVACGWGSRQHTHMGAAEVAAVLVRTAAAAVVVVRVHVTAAAVLAGPP